MKILIVSQYFPPESAFIVSTVASGLSSLGHEVEILTSFPNYPEGQIYDGYSQKWRERETIGDLRVTRVPMFIDHSTNPVRRALNYATFGMSAATAHRLAKDVDVVYVYATQMTAALGPWLWRILGGRPYVLHVQDLWPDSITGSSLVGNSKSKILIDRLLNPWLKSVYRRSSATIGIAPRMVETLIKRGSPSSKTHLVYNWSRPLESIVSSQRVDDDEIRILYAGNMGAMQDLATVIRAAAKTRNLPVRYIFVGDGVELQRLRDLAAELQVENVEFIGRVERAQMRKIYESCHFSLVTLKDLPVFEGTIPSKFQASMAYGVPVITTVKGDLRSLVENRYLGFTADPENVDSLCEVIERTTKTAEEDLEKMRENSSSTYRELFREDYALANIDRILLSVAESGTYE